MRSKKLKQQHKIDPGPTLEIIVDTINNNPEVRVFKSELTEGVIIQSMGGCSKLNLIGTSGFVFLKRNISRSIRR